MSTISGEQTKEEELHNYPFDAEIFRRTFNRYVRTLNTIFFTSVLLICVPFMAYAVALYLEQAKVNVTGFLNLWYAGESLLMDLGFPHVSFGIFSSGIIAVGHMSVRLISVGNFSCGVISIGVFGSCGVISIGGLSSAGTIAIGNNNVYGLVAIATGNKRPFEKGVYMNGKAFGFISFGRQARGVYVLSYGDEGEGTYQFSPKRQDPEAVALFTPWYKKFKNAFVLPS